MEIYGNLCQRLYAGQARLVGPWAVFILAPAHFGCGQYWARTYINLAFWKSKSRSPPQYSQVQQIACFHWNSGIGVFCVIEQALKLLSNFWLLYIRHCCRNDSLPNLLRQQWYTQTISDGYGSNFHRNSTDTQIHNKPLLRSHHFNLLQRSYLL